MDRAACVILRKTPGMTRISVSEPTQKEATVVIDLANTTVSRANGPDAGRVSVVRRADGARVTVDVSAAAGRTVEFVLQR